MDKRIELKKQTILKLSRTDGGFDSFTIDDVVGRGGSSIVYNAYATDNLNYKKIYRIKECYPYFLQIKRNEDGELYSERDRKEFDEQKTRFEKAYRIGQELFDSAELTNSTVNSLNLYKHNNTLYVVTSYMEGETLSEKFSDYSFREIISIVRSITKTIEKIHEKGYLYLDIKPENVLTLYGTTELIQLFDFDSMIPIKEVARLHDQKLSYSRSFAALELKQGRLSAIDIRTDIFSLGALLFYMVFGRTPNPLECDKYFRFDFTKCRFSPDDYSGKLFNTLTEIFHNTLSSSNFDRYDSCADLIEKLDDSYKYSQVSVPHLKNYKCAPIRSFIGRTDEISYIQTWFKDDNSTCLVVHGMGGIGKSTLVQKCIQENETPFDSITYLDFKGSVIDTITDQSFMIYSFDEKALKESKEDYFIRKMNAIKNIVEKEKSLLVIDNFDGEQSKGLQTVIDAGWKVILVSRVNHIPAYDHTEVRELSDEDAFKLFTMAYDKEVTAIDIPAVSEIIRKVDKNTMLIELLARQITSSYLSLQEAKDLVCEKGFLDIAPEKVRYIKDSETYHAKLANIVGSIFNISNLPSEARSILKVLSLYGTETAYIEEIMYCCLLTSRDIFNDLAYSGWIKIHDSDAHLHPVISESVLKQEWSDDDYSFCLSFMERIYLVQNTEEKKYRTSKREWETFQKLKRWADKSELFKKSIDQAWPDVHMFDKAFKIKIDNSDRYNENETYFSKRLMKVAQIIEPNIRKIQKLHDSAQYAFLLTETLFNTQYKQSEFAMSVINEFVNLSRRFVVKEILPVYEFYIILTSRLNKPEVMERMLQAAYEYAERCKLNYTWAQYYSAEARYYDELLNGAYENRSADEDQIHNALLDSTDKSIRYMEKANWRNPFIRQGHPRSEFHLAQNRLSKVNILLRDPDNIENAKEISHLMNKIEKTVIKEEGYPSELLRDYYLVKARLCILEDPLDYKEYRYLCHNALEVTYQLHIGYYERIQCTLVPIAEMNLMIKDYEASINALKLAIQICEKSPNSEEYIRTNYDLHRYLLDVYDESNDLNKASEMIEFLDTAFERYPQYDIKVYDYQDIKEKIQKNKG